jgi:hypothetical protein
VLPGDAALVFVVEGEAEGIAKGGERPLGGIRLGGLEGNVMRGLSRSRSTDTGADALANNIDLKRQWLGESRAAGSATALVLRHLPYQNED